MKFLHTISIVLLILINLTNVSAQSANSFPMDEETGRILYREVVKEQGDQNAFFNRAVAWINTQYVNPADATKVRDYASGKIEIRHRFMLKYTDNKGNVVDAGRVRYSLFLELKEGRYRYSLTSFDYVKATKFPVERWMNKEDPHYSEEWPKYLQQIDAFAQELITGLKAAMKPEIKKQEEEW